MRIALAIAAAGCAAVCLCAQPALDRPMLGQMLDRQGALRPVSGVGGSFQLDAPVAGRVLASACSREMCVAKTEFAIVSGASSAPAPPGPAFIAIDGTSAVLYFPATKQFARWSDGALAPLDVQVDGDVLAVRSRQGVVNVAVRRASGVWIIASDGAILDSLPPESSAVAMLADGVVYSTAGELVLRRTGGAEVRFAVSGVTALFAMGEDYVEALTSEAAYALRTGVGREALYVLPQAPARVRFPERR